MRSQNTKRNGGRRLMTTPTLAPHGSEWLEWVMPGGGASAARGYAASIPASLGEATVNLTSDTAGECVTAGLELAVVSRSQLANLSHAVALSSLLARAETLASGLIDGHSGEGRPSWRRARRGCLRRGRRGTLAQGSRRCWHTSPPRIGRLVSAPSRPPTQRRASRAGSRRVAQIPHHANLARRL